MPTLKEWQDRVLAVNEEKGWNEGAKEKAIGDWCMLKVTEIAEAYEDHRAGRSPTEIYWEDESGRKYSYGQTREAIAAWANDESPSESEKPTFKPCGIPIEMIDTLYRVLHFCAVYGLDADELMEMKMAYNKTRPYRHGGKRT
jgi:hypothetical protein